MQQIDEESLRLVIDLLHKSQIPDNAKQREVHQKINELSRNPDFCNYLVYILSLKNESDLTTVRRIAGATLKGYLESNWNNMTSSTLEYVKLTLLNQFEDANAGIRSVVANSITALFIKLGIAGWSELIIFLENHLSHNQQEVVESSLECISKILEDIKMNTENASHLAQGGFDYFHNLISKLINMCDPQLPPRIREHALHCLNVFVLYMDTSHLNNYFNILLLFAEDQDLSLRQKSCEGFLEAFEYRDELILDNLDKTLERIICFTMDSSIEIKKVACRFLDVFLLLGKNETLARIMELEKYMQILPSNLVDCLQYTKEDLMSIENEATENSRLHQGDDSDYNENDANYSDDVEGGYIGEWTLRKEAAKALDKLARYFKENVFINVQEKIAHHLRSSEWTIKESAILCLGALAKGAQKAIIPHLSDIFPFLIQSLSDEHPLVRSITCWAVSQFSEWVIDESHRNPKVLQVYLAEILKRLTDENFKVQGASCTALAKIIATNGQMVEAYTRDIVEVLKFVFDKYPKKSLPNLYDTIGTLSCNVAQSIIQQPQIEGDLIGMVTQKWNESQFNDTESIYLVECTDTILSALDKTAAKHASYFLGKSLFLVLNYRQAIKNNDKKYIYHKKEIALRSLEIFSTLLKALGTETIQYLSNTDFQLVVQECSQDQDTVIRQFILSVVGEVAKYCPSLLAGSIGSLVDALLANLVLEQEENDPDEVYQSNCNNTVWSLGEISIAYPDEFRPYASEFTIRLCELINSNLITQKGLVQNLAIAIGRISLSSPDAVAPHLDKFLYNFCVSLKKFKTQVEKQQAFRGLFMAITKNPNGMLNNFRYLCEALIAFENPDPDIQELAINFVRGFKMIAGVTWNSYFADFPPELQENMKRVYGV